MAVYTLLTDPEVAWVAKAFGLGTLEGWQFISQGSINTNLWLATSSGRFFARHTTVRSAEELSFEAELLDHLAGAGFPAPVLVRSTDGARFIELASGRVSLFRYLAGEELCRQELTPRLLETLGIELSKMHRALSSFSGERKNPYGAERVEGWLSQLARQDSQLADELLGALAHSRRGRGLLPLGVVHADLFMDNVKWLGGRLSAIFDFEMACRDLLVLDLAIALNAWCFDGSYQPALGRALIRGYQLGRTLEPEEREQLFFEALFGSVRFTISRIRDFHLSPLPPERLARKDYRTYLARVRQLLRMGPEGFIALFGLKSPR
jgi:homoserine kinase type II